jgi:hypothetical protein
VGATFRPFIRRAQQSANVQLQSIFTLSRALDVISSFLPSFLDGDFQLIAIMPHEQISGAALRLECTCKNGRGAQYADHRCIYLRR